VNIYIAHEKTDSENWFEPETKGEMLLLVGPEGGFAEEEVQLAMQYGAQPITLGEYRLRAETASIAMLSRFIFQ
jgi:16S rRNA (uracil1498-N3)-methyltransferase